MKIIFAGTPEFSTYALEALLNSSHEVAAVYTQPDRPSGRGQKLTASPVKRLAELHHIPIHQPETLRDPKEQEILKNYHADVMVVVAYGMLIPKEVLALFPCVNIHPSLLPKWRGAAPIQRAIEAGDEKTGVTIMLLDEGWDTGPMLSQVVCPISPNDTSFELHEKLGKLGAKALLEVLSKPFDPKPQGENFTHAKKITKEETKIDWNISAEEVERKIRAFMGMHTEAFRVLKAECLEYTTEKPGTIITVTEQGIDVATGKGILRLLEIQLPGGRRLPVKEVLHGKKDLFVVGKIL